MDFKNTKNTFAHKTRKELKSNLLVYRIITKPFMVVLGKVSLKIALALRIPIKPFTNFMFKQFCGGESLNEILPLTKKLGQHNVKSIPDYSIEGVSDEVSFTNLIKEVKSVIDLASSNKNIPFAVFKPTGLIDAKFLTNEYPILSEEIVEYKNRLNEIFSYAKEKSVSVLVDAEDYMYQERIDDILLESMRRFNAEKAIIFTTLQMYRNDRLDYLDFIIEMAKRENFKIGIKFVRGAYMEKERERAKVGNYPDPINKSKEITDECFDAAILKSMENLGIISIFCGTHNEDSVIKLVELMAKNNIRNNDDRVYFSKLYGMRDNISFNLAAEDYNVAKYLPYGPIKEVMPYLVRRAEENSSMGSQAKSEIDMIKQELNR